MVTETQRYSQGAVLDPSNQVIETTVSVPGGALVTTRTGGSVWSYPNIHGDVVATADLAGVKQGVTVRYDPWGNTLAGVVDNSNGTWDYGWVGQHTKGQEHATLLPTVIEMGARIYDPTLGRFLAVDPIEGGTTSNNYAYVPDPINMYDLTGMFCVIKCGWGKAVKLVKKKFTQTVRFVKTAPTTGMAVAASRLSGRGGACGMNWSHMMIVCTSAKQGGMVQKGGTTYGSLYITAAPDVGEARMRHEEKHANQYAIFTTTGMAGLYGSAYAYSWVRSRFASNGGECNWLEKWAGFEDGGYRQCL